MTEAFVTLPARIWRDDQTGIWVSHCAPVGVYSQGETEGQALDALQDAVLLYAGHTVHAHAWPGLVAKGTMDFVVAFREIGIKAEEHTEWRDAVMREAGR